MNHDCNHSHHTILLVDDAEQTRHVTKALLRSFGYSVDIARNAEDALSRFDPKCHDLIVTDNSMPGLSGVELAHILKLRSPSTPVLMYTGSVPADPSCLDRVIPRSSPFATLRLAIEDLLKNRSAAMGESDEP